MNLFSLTVDVVTGRLEDAVASASWVAGLKWRGHYHILTPKAGSPGHLWSYQTPDTAHMPSLGQHTSHIVPHTDHSTHI